MADVPTGSSGEPGVEHRGGDTAPRPGIAFRYRLVDLSGSEVGVIGRDDPLRLDDVVLVASAVQETAWRVVSVLGKCAVVTRA